MFGWLSSAWNWAVGGLDDLWHKAVSLIQSVVSWTLGWINQLIGDINSVYQWTTSFITSVENWVESLYTATVSLANSIYHDVVSWVQGLINDVYSYAFSIAQWVSSWIDRIYNDITSWLRSVENWVVSNIWQPLYNYIKGAYDWITRYGSWVLYLLTHPDALVTILGGYLLHTWGSLARKYAGAVGRFLAHTLLSLSSEALGIIEDIIAGIL